MLILILGFLILTPRSRFFVLPNEKIIKKPCFFEQIEMEPIG